MIQKQLLLLLCLISVCLNTMAQDEIAIYKKLFNYSDSITKFGKEGIVSKDIYKTIKSLDTSYFASFFLKAKELIAEGKFNEAALIFYIGDSRQGYLSLANPDYKLSNGDSALLNSIDPFTYQEINLFLKSNIVNFTKILNLCKEWIVNNDYVYFSKNNNLKTYTELALKLEEMVETFSSKKTIFQLDWSREQTETRKAVFAETKNK